MKRDNPLAGLSVPSLEWAVSEAVGRLGGTLDLNLAKDRQRLIGALVRSLGLEFRWYLARAFEKACGKACEHVAALMEDEDYQAKRSAAQRQRHERRKQRMQENAAKQIDSEAARQKHQGLVQ